MTRFASLFVASLVVVACSSEDDPSSGASNNKEASALAAKYCDGVAMKTEPCFDEDDRKEAAECKTKEGLCAAYRFVPGVIDNLVECNKSFVYKMDEETGRCFTEPEEKGEDRCLYQAARALPADPAYDDFATKCYAKYKECGMGDGRFSDDFCDITAKNYVRDFDDFAKCLDEPCEKDVVKACFVAKLRQTNKAAGGPDSCFD